MAIQRKGAVSKATEKPEDAPVEEQPIVEEIEEIEEAPAVPDFEAALYDIVARANQPLPPPQAVQVPDLSGLIQAEFQKLIASGVFTPAAPAAPAESVSPVLPSFKAHYRNDESPDMMIQALDMSADRPQLHPIPGKYYRFRLGHFYTNDENAIRQIEWMRARPRVDGAGDTIGGEPSIYPDDGAVTFQCARCERTFPSKAAYDAHRASVHGVINN